jgi:inner membrane protein
MRGGDVLLVIVLSSSSNPRHPGSAPLDDELGRKRHAGHVTTHAEQPRAAFGSWKGTLSSVEEGSVASIGHALFGLAVARKTSTSSTTRRPAAAWLVFPALALLPDLDVIAFKLGIPYAAPFGHRGAAHALLVGVVGGGVVGALFAKLTRTKLAAGVVLGALAMVSHGLFDAMTTGGEGIALLWPFDTTRYFAPVRPIPVAPIGFGFLSARGLYRAAVELALFSPCLVVAFWPGRRRTG